MERYSERKACPICGGFDSGRQRAGERCWGYSLGRVVYCTRIESPVEDVSGAFQHGLDGRCRCGNSHLVPQRVETNAGDSHPGPIDASLPPVDVRNHVYSAMLDELAMRAELVAELNRRGLDSWKAFEWGMRSVPITPDEATALLGELRRRFGREVVKQVPGLVSTAGIPDATTRDGFVIPGRDEHGNITGILYRFYFGEAKYLLPKGSRQAAVRLVRGEPGADRSLVVVEGLLKAYAAHELGGVWAFGVNGQALMAEHVEALVDLQPDVVLLALDEDGNPRTAKARERWTKALHAAGFTLRRLTWEGVEFGGPKGIDDAYQQKALVRVRRVTRPMPELRNASPRLLTSNG